MLEAGLELPQELEAAWELWPGLESYQQAFRELDAEREWNSGMTSFPYPITQQALRAYALNHDFYRPYLRRQRFFSLVRAQDFAWLKWYTDRRKQ